MENNKKTGFSLKKALSSRRFRYGSLSVVFTAVFVALIIGLNLVISAFDVTHIFSIDLTDEEFYSISSESVEYLESLGSDFQVTVHFCCAQDKLETLTTSGYNYIRMVHETVLAFAEKFPENISVEYFDVTTDPKYVDKIKHYTQTTLNANNIIVEGKYHTRVLNYDSFYMIAESTGELYAYNGEARMVSAITQCSIKEAYSVVFTTGHGESFPTQLAAIFDDAGFEVVTADLMTLTDEELERTLENARIMVICDPQYDLVGYDANDPNTKDETDIINDFLNDNKSLMVFVDAGTPELPNLQEYLGDMWGVGYDAHGKLTDPTHSVMNGSNGYQLICQYAGEDGGAADLLHDTLTADAKTVFGNAVRLTSSSSALGAVVEVSCKTYPTAIPATGGAAGEYPLIEISTGRTYGENNALLYKYVMLCGSTDFVSNDSLTSAYGNREIIEAAARMMSTERVSPDIDYKTFTDTALTLESGTAETLSIIIIVVAPAIVLVLGIGVFIKRRHM